MFSEKRHLAILSGNMPHHLDHLAPFAYSKNAPLWIEDNAIAKMAKKYYPGIQIISKNFDFKQAADIADILVVSTKFAPMELKSIYSSIGNDQIQIAFLPHGQSDKGLQDPNLRSIQNVDIAYLYGDLQLKRVKEFDTFSTINSYAFTGNYRKNYYEIHKTYLDKLTEKEVTNDFDPRKKTILYAPTWSSEGFLNYTELLIEKLHDYNLIIKLHPLMEKSHPAHTILYQGLDKIRKNVRVLTSFPLIYPILSKTDIYIGDESAIGYDFLSFNKPMYFLSEKKTPLSQCGKIVKSIDELQEEISCDQIDQKEIRLQQYKEAFTNSSSQ